jgi:hypothetical protein
MASTASGCTELPDLRRASSDVCGEQFYLDYDEMR